MASTINADTSNGLVITPDTSGELELQSNGTTVLKVDSPTGSLTIPIGTTAERPVSPTVGMMRYNTTEAYYEQYDGSAWVEAGGSAYDAPTTSTGYFALSAGTTAQRPGSPATGMIRYNTTESEYEVYSSSNWKYLNASGYPIIASYLVIAGAGAGGNGGGGGGGGGGGAGGLLTGTATLTSGSVYTVTVGGGSAAGGTTGSNSVLSGTGITTQTAIRGGSGGNGAATAAVASGGSGGGAGTQGSGSTISGGSGTAGQGNAGGSAPSGGTWRGGSGGGSNAAGTTNGAGGAGKSNSITGSAVTYAGGGGVGRSTLGAGTAATAGGAGGGGAGANTAVVGTAGTANTGGGGGGGYGTGTNGGAGGSGVVILSIPTSVYTGTTTGSPTITTSGANTILKYTSSGSYTA